MSLGLTEALPSLVGTKFRSALASKQLVFSATELAVVRTSSGVPFQLRYCPALAKKPTAPTEDVEKPTKKRFDPFENPSPELLIAQIPASMPSHNLVLNKFPVIEDHFIIATKENKEQTHKLEQDDVALTYECLKAWEASGQEQHRGRLFAFFNSGTHSGASQPHRHLQFLPVESMRRQQSGDTEWKMLIDIVAASSSSPSPSQGKLVVDPSLPFVQFVKRISAEASGEELYQTYCDLYEAALASVRRFNKYDADADALELHSTDTGSLPISYNLAMTTEAMAICPRRMEGTILRGADGTDTDIVALNGTVLSGSLMVKGKREWDLLRERSDALDRLLESIGIPSQYGSEPTDIIRL